MTQIPDDDVLKSSRDYTELDLDAAHQFVKSNQNAWLHFEMPMRQYNAVVGKELHQYLHGQEIAPYDALVKLLRRNRLDDMSLLLDVGASTGYYSQVLEIANIPYVYTALDFSRHYAEAAHKLFDIPFILADATDMSIIPDGQFDIVVCGGVLMHTLEWRRVVDECFRVASKQVIFHRTPIRQEKPTQYFAKLAYGLPCLEIHFNRQAFRDWAGKNAAWRATDSEDVTWDQVADEGQVSYLYTHK